MAKISRNDSCPCGSGKKYKKCCLEKDFDTPISEESEMKEFETYINDFDSEQVIDLLIGIQLIPVNYGKNIRIEILAKEIVKKLRNGTTGNLSSLKNIIQKEFPDHPWEDPPEELFTENVLFHGGNYTTPWIAPQRRYF